MHSPGLMETHRFATLLFSVRNGLPVLFSCIGIAKNQFSESSAFCDVLNLVVRTNWLVLQTLYVSDTLVVFLAKDCS